MKTLPKLSEYVDLRPMTSTFDTEQSDWYYKEVQLLDEIRNYTNFITQPLNLSHFVPAIEKDGKWVVLEEPKKEQFLTISGLYQTDYHKKAIQEYQTALDNVVFKGFEYENKEHLEEFSTLKNDKTSFNYDEKYMTFEENRFYIETIEDLIPYNLEVNDNIIKKFNL